MLLLSLGPQVIAALLAGPSPRDISGPDLSWLLFGPEMTAAAAPPEENPQALQAAE
jgi:hypothetical protein